MLYTRASASTPNALHLAFHPRLMRPFLEDWPRLARGLLAQLQRDALARPGDPGIADLIRELCAYPDVPSDLGALALELPPTPALEFGLRRGELRARFLTTLTLFNAPLDVTVEDLRLESYFPADDETERLCRTMS